MANLTDSLKILLGIEAKGFKQVENQIKNFTHSVNHEFSKLKGAVAGYFTADALIELTKAGIEYATHAKDIAEQTGITTKEFQELDAAFKKVGLSGDDAVVKLDAFLAFAKEAREGSTDEKFNLLKKYGVSFEDLKALEDGSARAIDIVRKMASPAMVMGGAENAGVRADFGEIFGKKFGGKMLAGLVELQRQGPITIIDEEQIKLLDDAEKRLARIKKEASLSAATHAANWLDFLDYFTVDFRGGTKKERDAAKNEALGIGPEAENVDLLTRRKGNYRRKRTAEAQSGIDADNANQLAYVRKMVQENPNDPFWEERLNALDPHAEGVLAARKKGQTGLADSVRDAFLKTSNSSQRRQAIPGEMKALMDRAEKEEADALAGKKGASFETAAGYRKKAVSLGSELAELSKTENYRPQQDSLAAVGGLIGGAAVGSPISIQQDIKSILERILAEYPGLQQAIKDASTTKAIEVVQ